VNIYNLRFLKADLRGEHKGFAVQLRKRKKQQSCEFDARVVRNTKSDASEFNCNDSKERPDTAAHSYVLSLTEKNRSQTTFQ